MTMMELQPMEVVVSCDRTTGRPQAVKVGPDEVGVLAVERIRDESAAYPAHMGPRTIYIVRTERARIRLALRHRDHRWLMEGIDPLRADLPRAA